MIWSKLKKSVEGLLAASVKAHRRNSGISSDVNPKG